MVVALVGGVVAGVLAGGSSPHRAQLPPSAPPSATSQAQKWVTALGQDLDPISGSLVGLLQSAQSWAGGTSSASALSAQIVGAMPSFDQTLGDVANQQPLPAAPTAKPVAADAIDLYLAALRLEQAATGLPAGALRHQLQQSFERIRELGDRVYDLATTLATGPPPPSTATNTNIRPADVPDWTALGLAAGPPLDSPPAPAAKTPPTFQVTRPQQSIAGWVAAVDRSGVPAASTERQDILSTDDGTLRQLADQAQAALNELDATADPDLDRNAGTQTRLDLLVTEEAARAAEASGLVSLPTVAKSSLEDVAQILAEIADQLWNSQLLGRRSTGFSASLLAARSITSLPRT